MSLADLIRKRPAGQVATATPATFATHEQGKAATVARVATVAVANPRDDETDALPDPAAEARRQRVLDMLAGNPALRIAVVCDGEGDPVPVAVAIRDKGSCEVHIPAARFDPFALLELVERHGGTLH